MARSTRAKSERELAKARAAQKAHKLRRRLSDKKTLTEAERKWLRTYQQSVKPTPPRRHGLPPIPQAGDPVNENPPPPAEEQSTPADDAADAEAGEAARQAATSDPTSPPTSDETPTEEAKDPPPVTVKLESIPDGEGPNLDEEEQVKSFLDDIDEAAIHELCDELDAGNAMIRDAGMFAVPRLLMKLSRGALVRSVTQLKSLATVHLADDIKEYGPMVDGVIGAGPAIYVTLRQGAARKKLQEIQDQQNRQRGAPPPQTQQAAPQPPPAPAAPQQPPAEREPLRSVPKEQPAPSVQPQGKRRLPPASGLGSLGRVAKPLKEGHE